MKKQKSDWQKAADGFQIAGYGFFATAALVTCFLVYFIWVLVTQAPPPL